MNLRPRTSALCALLTLAPALAAQQERWSVAGRLKTGHFGESMAALPDLDGDGVRDLLIGNPEAHPAVNGGSVHVVSGKSLVTLLELSGAPLEGFGHSVADGGDIDGDGTQDFLVGAPGANAARAFSGVNGALLHEWSRPNPLDGFGTNVVGLGDVDGDGLGDVVIASPFESAHGKQERGVVRVFSGANFLLLQSFEGASARAHFGDRDRMANVGDIDGDGIADLAIVDIEDSATFVGDVVRVVSAATGSELLAVRFDAGSRLNYRATTIAPTADRDGDGRGDLLIGARRNLFAAPGRALVLSSANGAELLVVDGPENSDFTVARDIGDRDGDGLTELVLTIQFTRFNFETSISLHRGSDGAELDSFSGSTNGLFGLATLCDLDVDGDGLRDMTMSDPNWVDRGLIVGAVQQRMWPGGTVYVQQNGEGEDQLFDGALAALDDVDGDGANDFVAANLAFSGVRDSVRVGSGRDGSTLADHRVGGRPDGALVALPDLDGDGHDDYAIGLDTLTNAPRVEVRSSSGGGVLQSFAGSGGSDLFGGVMAAGVHPSGAIHLAIGAPGSSLGSTGGGAVWVFDAASGVQQFRKTGAWLAEGLGSSVAWIGDVNGDGTGDWAFGGPRHGAGGKEAGRVLVVSGNAGGTLASHLGLAGDHFGSSLASLRDLNGDGLNELVVAASDRGANDEGAVTVLAGGSWNQLSTVVGAAPGDRLGTKLVSLRDLNGDGADEWAALALAPRRFELRDGDHGRLLANVPVDGNAGFELLAAAAPWQLGSTSGDAVDDLLAIDPDGPTLTGRAWLIALDDLLLQFEPAIARDGDTVYAHLRGGPSFTAAGLLLLDVNGAPVNQWIGLATFDGQGKYFACGDVGPGLAGLTMTVQGFGIGFDGKLKDSQAQVLTFE